METGREHGLLNTLNIIEVNFFYNQCLLVDKIVLLSPVCFLQHCYFSEIDQLFVRNVSQKIISCGMVSTILIDSILNLECFLIV